jgi:hypothetical protein
MRLSHHNRSSHSDADDWTGSELLASGSKPFHLGPGPRREERIWINQSSALNRTAVPPPGAMSNSSESLLVTTFFDTASAVVLVM